MMKFVTVCFIVSFNICRYNELEQPVCRVCDVVLKSESHWDAHQVSRKHHEVIFYYPHYIMYETMTCKTHNNLDYKQITYTG
jgi:hypothetical protein